MHPNPTTFNLTTHAPSHLLYHATVAYSKIYYLHLLSLESADLKAPYPDLT